MANIDTLTNEFDTLSVQHFTTKALYMFEGLTYPPTDELVIEPFYGNGDLVKNIENKTVKYDIDPNDDVIYRDTLYSPPDYNEKYVMTNPPFLAKNKAHQKDIFQIYNRDDLYKCFLQSLINNPPKGGILVLPLNFWCSDVHMRKAFLKHFKVHRVNVFEEDMFANTTYTVCAFSFEYEHLLKYPIEDQVRRIPMTFYPNKISKEFLLSKKNNFTIGGHIYRLPQNTNYLVNRLVANKNHPNTNIIVQCIDNNEQSPIHMYWSEEPYWDRTNHQTARSYASLVIEPQLSKEQQCWLIERFNSFIQKERKEYQSMFLTTYRETKGICRKRIEFSLLYSIVKYILREIV